MGDQAQHFYFALTQGIVANARRRRLRCCRLGLRRNKQARQAALQLCQCLMQVAAFDQHLRSLQRRPGLDGLAQQPRHLRHAQLQHGFQPQHPALTRLQQLGIELR